MSQNIAKKPLKAGLYVVATPIGNLGDITYRALETLASVQLIACEDTRVTGRLLHHFGLKTPMEPYHDHNAARMRPAIIETAKSAPVALVSDAGTPLISDPGYKLVREAVAEGVHVEALPGASSVMTALAVASLPTDRFFFAGFLPAGDKQASDELAELAAIPSTLVFFESAKRVAESLARMSAQLGPREACVARELTKLYEEAVRGTLPELAAHYAKAGEPRGEVVIVVGPPLKKMIDDSMIDDSIKKRLGKMSLKDAVAEVMEELGLPHKKIYARALELKNDGA